MRFPFYLLLAMVSLIAACSRPEPALVIPGERPDPATAAPLLETVIRYLGKMPDKATHQTKFDTLYDAHYDRQAEMHRLDRYYRDTLNGDLWLLVSRVAPSIHVRRVSTGIHCRMDSDSLRFYHEVFRTWKLPEEVLLPRADSLFARMVRGEDLRPWYTERMGDQYIEFPDAHTRFDTLARRWVSDLEDPVTPLKEEILKATRGAAPEEN